MRHHIICEWPQRARSLMQTSTESTCNVEPVCMVAWGHTAVIKCRVDNTLMPPGSTCCEAGLYSVRSSCLLTLHAAGVQKTLLKGYDRVLGDEPSRQETSFSLRAVGCFGTGLHQQVCSQLLPKYAALASQFDTRVCCCYFCPPCCFQLLQSGEHAAGALSGLWDRTVLFVRMNGFAVSQLLPGLMLLTLYLIPCEVSPTLLPTGAAVIQTQINAASEGDVIALSYIDDRLKLFFNILLQTIDICAEWLNHVGKGGHAVWANVLTAYARLNLARRPHKLRQVTTHTSFQKFCLLTYLLGAFVQVSAPSSFSTIMIQAWCTNLPDNFKIVWLARSWLVWRTFLYILQLFTLISKTCQASVKAGRGNAAGCR